MDWQPEPGEMLQLRTVIAFATGMAPPVVDSHWFRDTERRDIQHELSGWPEGPTYTLHSKKRQAGGRLVRGMAVALPLLGNVLANADVAGGTPFGDPELRGKTQDPENEFDDFPVMWAAPGSTARTMPWQLDRARRGMHLSKQHRTEAVITNRRVIILCGRPRSDESVAVVWEQGRDCFSGAEVMEYSNAKADVRVTFADGSWVRLTTGDPFRSRRLAHLLSGRARTLRLEELTGAQQRRINEELASLPSDAEPPICTLLPSGVLHVQITVPSKQSVQELLLNREGQFQQPQPGDL